MTRNIFVSLALIAGMASPAFAQDTRTLDVRGSTLERPTQYPQLFGAPATVSDVTGRPVRWTGAVLPDSVQAEEPGVPLYAGDEDGDNAKNPALPSYARGRGEETGGPDRMQIPD